MTDYSIFKKNTGIKFAINGADTKSNDTKDFIVYSQYPFFKEAKFGQIDITFSSTPGAGDTLLATIPHNFGYTPAAYVLETSYSDIAKYLNFRVSDLFMTYPFGSIIATFYCVSDSSNLKIYLSKEYNGIAVVGMEDRTPKAGDTYTFRYYIAANEGA